MLLILKKHCVLNLEVFLLNCGESDDLIYQVQLLNLKYNQVWIFYTVHSKLKIEDHCSFLYNHSRATLLFHFDTAEMSFTHCKHWHFTIMLQTWLSWSSSTSTRRTWTLWSTHPTGAKHRCSTAKRTEFFSTTVDRAVHTKIRQVHREHGHHCRITSCDAASTILTMVEASTAVPAKVTTALAPAVPNNGVK